MKKTALIILSIWISVAFVCAESEGVYDYAAAEMRKKKYEEEIAKIDKEITSLETENQKLQTKVDSLSKKYKEGLEIRKDALARLEDLKIQLRTVLSRTSEIIEKQKKLNSKHKALNLSLAQIGSQEFAYSFEIENNNRRLKVLKEKKEVYQKNLGKAKTVLAKAGSSKTGMQDSLNDADALSDKIDAFLQ